MYNYSISAIVPMLLKEYLVFANDLWFIIGLLHGVFSKCTVYVLDYPNPHF